jgi:hypothetical protein
MDNISYILKKIDSKTKEAKIVSFKNDILVKTIDFPAVMFHVNSQEDIDAIKQYYFQQYPDNHIFGFTIPFNKLPTFIPQLLKNVPHDVYYMCDLNTEFFWSGNIKPEIKKSYYNYIPINEKIKEKINSIGMIEKINDRIEFHKNTFQEIVNNKNVLMSFLTSYINRQNGYQISIISSFAPLILNSEHLDLVEECYIQTKKLYHSSINDIEKDGKLIGLFANFHTNFLAKKPNIGEFIKMIERTEPKALIFKFFNLKDIRERRTLQENYNLLIKEIGKISATLRIPTFYFSSHTEGLKSQTKGIDVFCEPFNHINNIDLKHQMNKLTLERMRRIDPLYKSGRIYDYRTGNLITRREFQGLRLHESYIDSPISLFDIKSDTIISMTDKRFRDFSKMLLMATRNFEDEELHLGISNDNLERVHQKIYLWEGVILP